ncbi:DMT family transporter [Acetobacteraceae bacterium]|nr:DMT family transporter [Acetobacteraceae bacterium]
MKASPTLGILLALGGWGTFSVSDAFSKMLHGILPASEVACSGGLFGLLLIPFFLKKGKTSLRDVFPKKADLLSWIIRACAFFAATALSVKAFMLLPMSEAMAFIFLCPVFTNLLEVFFLKQKVHLMSWVSAFVGFIGVLLVLRPGIRPLGIGDYSALGVAFALAVAIITLKYGEIKIERAKRAGHSEKDLPKEAAKLSIFSSTLAGPMIGNGILMLPDFQRPEGLRNWGFLLGYALLMAFGQILLIYAAKTISSGRVALTQYSQMLWALVLDMLLFADKPDALAWAGSALILFSGFIELFGEKKSKAKREAKVHLLKVRSADLL